jgi:hypothetical protein
MSPANMPRDQRDQDMIRSYVGVVIVWLATLLSLFAFQEYFR